MYVSKLSDHKGSEQVTTVDRLLHYQYTGKKLKINIVHKSGRLNASQFLTIPIIMCYL